MIKFQDIKSCPSFSALYASTKVTGSCYYEIIFSSKNVDTFLPNKFEYFLFSRKQFECSFVAHEPNLDCTLSNMPSI